MRQGAASGDRSSHWSPSDPQPSPKCYPARMRINQGDPSVLGNSAPLIRRDKFAAVVPEDDPLPLSIRPSTCGKEKCSPLQGEGSDSGPSDDAGSDRVLVRGALQHSFSNGGQAVGRYQPGSEAISVNDSCKTSSNQDVWRL